MGPLKDIKVIEMAGIGPAPFCGMILADMGAEVISVERITAAGRGSSADIASRGKKSIAVDIRKSEGQDIIKKLVESADVLIEGFRPGVMEKNNLGPDELLKINPKLIFGRMTGWGQNGPLANAAGHDINYIALSGVLGAIGKKDTPPPPPLNLIGDFGGGGMLLALGVCAALNTVNKEGKGQVIDAAMTEGSALLMSMMYGMLNSGIWTDSRDSNLLDGAAHFYGCYECKDGKFVSIGSIEPQFYSLLREKMNIDEDIFDNQMDKNSWPALRENLENRFKEKTRDEWCQIMEGTDICFAPVLSMNEAINHEHNVERKSFFDLDNVVQPSPAPKFSYSESEVSHPPVKVGTHTKEIMISLGLEEKFTELTSQQIISEA
ncbi:MAG: CaiB/BaiF CoA-transferase family protein [Gammaproteobacteria bacterium]